MQHDAQGIFPTGRTGQEPQEVAVGTQECGTGEGGISAEERRARKLQYNREWYRKNKEYVKLFQSSPKYRKRESDLRKEARKDPAKKVKISKYRAAYYAKNKERILARCKTPEYLKRLREHRKKKRVEDPAWRDKQLAYQRANYPSVKDRLNSYRSTDAYKAKQNHRLKQKRNSDPAFAIKVKVKNTTGNAFRRRGLRKPNSTLRVLGCTWEVLMGHIEKQFLPGMTRDNRGRVWHVDHWIPFAAVDLTNPVHVEKVCHYTNLRPLWGLDNLKKSGRITPEVRQRMNEVFGEESIRP